MSKSLKLKYFFTSMLSTFLLLMLFCGFVVVEKNVRYVAFGENVPFFSYFVSDNDILFKIHFMGQDIILDVPKISGDMILSKK